MAIPTMGGAQLWADCRWRAGWRVQRHVRTGHARLLDPNDRRHTSGQLMSCEARLGSQGLPSCPEHVVVLLHGLARTRRALAGMAAAVDERGHTAVNVDYPSTRAPLEDHVTQLIDLLGHLDGVARVSFVTHSLGGIVARGALADRRWPKHLRAERLVMLAPPNQGASFARLIDEHAPTLFGAVMGPSGRAIGDGVPYPVPTIPTLVIAGSQREGKGLNPVLDGDDDGVVRVDETKLPEPAQHLVVPALHTLIMDHPGARAATLSFLSGEPSPTTGPSAQRVAAER